MTQPHHNGSESMRDARLAQALKHMPDAHMQPDAQTRNAVLQAALQALEGDRPPTPQTPQRRSTVWHWLVGQPGQRLPLTGALASLLIASFAIVMWYGQDVPDANPESVAVADKAENAVPSKPQSTESATTLAVPATPAANLPAAPPPLALAKKSAAERSGARPQATQKAEPAQPQVATAKSAAKEMTPAPAAIAPAPVVAAVAVPPPAPAVVAAPPPMAESTARARREDVAQLGTQVLLDGQRRTLTATQSEPLMATLRALTVQADAPRKPVEASDANGRNGALAGIEPRQEPKVAADRAVSSLASEATFTVQTPDGQRWDISPNSLRSSMAGVVRTSPLTRAQWLQLRALASPPVPPGNF